MDLDEQKTKNKADRFDILQFKDAAVLFMRKKCEISLKGKAVIQAVQGKVSILGFNLTSNGSSYSVYSPNSHSLLTLTTSKSRDSNYDLEKLKSLIRAEIPSVSDSELSEVIALAKQRSAVLLLKLLSSQVCDFISDFDHFKELFAGLSEKHELCQGTYVDAVKLQVIQNASNKMIIPDFYEDIGTQFLKLSENDIMPAIVLCGGKDSGKSTFCRYLINKTLNSHSSVAYLECDIGQTEFTAPGCVSLCLVSEPVLGPPFTHNKQPLSMCYTGSVSPSSNPWYYLECLKYVYRSYCKMETKPPLIINTMGWTEGLGLFFVAETLRLTRPTVVVQLESVHLKQNFHDTLTPNFITEYVKTEEYPGHKKCRTKRVDDALSYDLFKVMSPVARDQENKRQLAPADHRNLMSLAYLGQNLSSADDIATLHNIPLHKVLLKDIAIRIFGADLPRSHLLAAINATIVALCSLDEGSLSPADLPMFPKSLRQSPIDCLGFGLVHHVSIEDEAIYIITPLSPNELARVNCLMSGCDGVPKQLLLKIKTSRECPYVAYPKDGLGCSSLKARGRFMQRKRGHSECESKERR